LAINKCEGHTPVLMQLQVLLQHLSSVETTIALLRAWNILPSIAQCAVCDVLMVEIHTTTTDGRIWRCSKQHCRKKLSIRARSFFAGSKLNLRNQVLFLHLWSKKYTSKQMVDDFGFTLPTIVDWSRYCRDIALWYIETIYETKPIGGIGRTVEIDETLIVRRKYNRGRMLKQEWLFGGVERRTDGTWSFFLEFVPDRTAQTLTEIIMRRIEPGTIIISDGWPSYGGIKDLGYGHQVINHSKNFVDPNDPSINTQRIENFWMHLKRFLKSKGTNRAPHNWEYVCEFIFRRIFSDTFTAMIHTIAQKYPLTH
jgi:ISXO2-like transposase domain